MHAIADVALPRRTLISRGPYAAAAGVPLVKQHMRICDATSTDRAPSGWHRDCKHLAGRPGSAITRNYGISEKEALVRGVVCMFGPLSVSVDGHPVKITSPNERALFAALAMDAGRPVSLNKICRALWHKDYSENLEGALRPLITRARKTLGAARGLIATEPSAYQLMVSPDDVDILAFQSRYEAGRPVAVRGRQGRGGCGRLAAGTGPLPRGSGPVEGRPVRRHRGPVSTRRARGDPLRSALDPAGEAHRSRDPGTPTPSRRRRAARD
jgi:hypothetical protein